VQVTESGAGYNEASVFNDAEYDLAEEHATNDDDAAKLIIR
jgi:hypothetical protein